VKEQGLGTRAVHSGGHTATGPLTTPIVQASTFSFASAEEMRRYLAGDEELFLYTRYANPTLAALETGLASLEGAEAGLVFASGMAAMTTGVLSLLEPGDEVLASSALYGGTTRFVREILPKMGFGGRVVPSKSFTRLKDVVGPKSRVLVVESPTNPSLQILDLQAICAEAHDLGLRVVVDNTFATPFLQRPLSLGADLVMHSLTKALAGHSDIIGGALLGPRALIDSARSWLKVLGGCMDPHPAFLALRGLKTVHLRVARQCENAQILADALLGHPKLASVHYPGLSTHPGHDVARRQMSAFGGIVAFVLHGGLPAAERFFDGLQLVRRAVSLGGVESLVSLPVHTSHHGYTPEQLAAAGVAPGMVRLSLGVEDAADVVADVQQALAAV
jgi:cystathionine beta-lyase/cystathionine gamma-synthase